MHGFWAEHEHETMETTVKVVLGARAAIAGTASDGEVGPSSSGRKVDLR